MIFARRLRFGWDFKLPPTKGIALIRRAETADDCRERVLLLGGRALERRIVSASKVDLDHDRPNHPAPGPSTLGEHYSRGFVFVLKYCSIRFLKEAVMGCACGGMRAGGATTRFLCTKFRSTYKPTVTERLAASS